MTDCSVMKIDKKSMNDVLHREHAFSDMFVAYLLARNIRETDAGPTEFTLGMDRRSDHHGGNVRRGRGHVRCFKVRLSLATSSRTLAHLSELCRLDSPNQASQDQ
jgi:hypothetical protein